MNTTARTANGVAIRRDGKGDALMQRHRYTLPRNYYCTDIDYVISDTAYNTVCIVDEKYTEQYMYTNNTHNIYASIATMTNTVMMYTITYAKSSPSTVYYVDNTNNNTIKPLPKISIYDVAQHFDGNIHTTSDKMYVEYVITNKKHAAYAILIRDMQCYQIANNIANKLTDYYKSIKPEHGIEIGVYYIDDNSIIHNCKNNLQAQLGNESWIEAYAAVGIVATRDAVIAAVNDM